MNSTRAEVRTIVLVAVFATALSSLPVFVTPSFYFSDDSAAQFLPMWHVLGEQILRGEWPVLLRPDSWMGGNVAAEVLFGIWNPVHLLDYVLVVWIADLALAAAVVKIQFLVILAVGVHLLCRSYGASRASASVLGVALPVSGFVLYFEAATWAGGLMGFAWLPWSWWSLRRLSRDGGNSLPAFLLCYLCVSAGDPYGALALCLVFAALLVECRLNRRKGVSVARESWRVVRIGIAIALTTPLIFGPLLAASSVSWRSGLVLFNDGLFVPGLGDVVNLSMPSFVPRIQSFGSYRMTVPAVYFAWFVIPLAAWMDWRVLLTSWRRFTAPIVLTVCYLLLCLGPSHVWLFRWPLRHVAVLYLSLSVVLAVALSKGLRTDQRRSRMAFSVVAVLFGAYLSFSAWPGGIFRHLIGLGLLSGLAWGALRANRSVTVMLHIGTACVLVLQVLWFPVNRDVADYHFPADVGEIRTRWADLHGRTTLQIADRERVSAAAVASGEAWDDLLFGNMHALAGVPSLTAYTGIGFRDLHRRLCLSYYGSTCPQAYDTAWSADETGTALVDQLKVEHVVVQRKMRDVPRAPAGWRVAERSREVTRLDRINPSPWPEGKLSVVHGIAGVSDRHSERHRETVHWSRREGATADVVFARLNWPGYSATVNGQDVPVRSTSSGLVHVRIPPGFGPGTVQLSWDPPGWILRWTLASVGILMMTIASIVDRVRGRRC